MDYIRKTGPFQYLICIDVAGSVLWQASLPTENSTDAYVRMEHVGDSLFANSWSGFWVTISAQDGSISDNSFTQ